MSDHSHAVGQLGAAEAGEEKGAMEAMGNGTVHRHGQRVKGGTRGQDAHQEALTHAKFCVDITGPAANTETWQNSLLPLEEWTD